MKTKPEMTDSEIRSHMDFDRLLSTHQQHRGGSRHPVKILWLASSIVIVGTIVMLLKFQFDGSSRVNRNESASAAIWKKDSAERSSNLKNDEAVEDSSRGSQINPKQPASRAKADKKKLIPLVGNKDEVVVKQLPKEHKEAGAIYVQAEPLAGYPDLYKYFAAELKYPKEALKDSLQGEVIAVFTINPLGQPEKISIQQSLGPAFDKEVVRLISDMPRWKPATYNSSPVASTMSLPLTFKIETKSSEK